MLSRSPRWRRRLTVAAALLLVAVGAAVWFQATSRPRVNVLLITLDTTRADRIGCYGHKPALTPVLDKLAEQGVRFEQAYAPIPLTLPSHASMFTGLYPPEHGIHTNGKNRLPDDLPTLAEACVARGYDTGAFIASFVVDRKFGLNRGFQTYDDDLTGTTPTEDSLHRNRDGDVVVSRALDWLKGRAGRPFFCWVHLYDPHTPYVDHSGRFGDRFQDQPYDAEIAYVDVQIGRLADYLKTLGPDAETLVVVVGDHGEGLGQHDERRHGQMLYNSTLHVPWIMSWPGRLPAGQRVSTPVSLVDLSPTLRDALRLKQTAKISGRSLWPAAKGEPLAARPLYAETDEPWLESGWSPLRAVIDGDWKYIRTPKAELFELAQDAEETRNLAAELPEKVEELERRLADLESGLQLRIGSVVQLTDQERRQLSGLGYLGHTGDSRAGAPDQNLHDIKEMIGHYNSLEDAVALLDERKFAEAEERLRAIVAAAPDYELAELTLGDVFLRQRKLDEAWDIYHRVFERNPESALAILHLGDVREAQGRYEESLEHYQQALEYEPDSAKLNYNIGRLLVILHRDAEAIRQFKQVLELDPGYVFAHIELGSALSRQGLFDSALAEYELALKYDARSVLAHMNAASVLAQQGRAAAALNHLTTAAKIAPEDVEIRFVLASFLASQGRADEARPHLEAALRLQPDHAGARQLSDQLGRRNK